MSSGDTSNFSLFLRPKQRDHSDEDTLARRFAEIVQKKGHFRLVTQESLLADEESDDEDDAGSQGDPADNATRDAEDTRGTLKHVQEGKQKMVQMVSTAHNQAMLLVDFVSLLESKYNEAGQFSMSPGIRAVVQPRTLAYDQWPARERSSAEKATDLLIAQGQRLQGLNTAADDLLKAAARLQDDVKRETTYWDDVLSVTDAGWAVCRVAKGQHQLGVQLGFPQAGPLFRYRGYVPLTSGEDGALKLGQRAAQRPKKLRLRIIRDGQASGTNLSGDNELDEGIEDRIRAARDSLLEEELFHELTIEARSLMGYGIRSKKSPVHIPRRLLGDDEPSEGELLIDLVSQDHREPSSNEPLLDEHAARLALVLRMLMMHTYQQRLIAASKPPAALSERKQEPVVSRLLRPLISQACHSLIVVELRQYLNQVQQVLDLAKIERKDITVTSLTAATAQRESKDLLAALSGPCQTEISLKPPSGVGEVVITIHTEIAPLKPLTSSRLTITNNPRLSPETATSNGEIHNGIDDRPDDSHAKQHVFDDREDLVSYLNEFWALDIASNMIAEGRKGATAVELEPEIRIAYEDDNAKSSSVINLRVGYNAAGLRLLWRKSHTKGATGQYRWTVGDRDGKSLEDVLGDIMRGN